MNFRLTLAASVLGIVSFVAGLRTASAQFPGPPQPAVQYESNGLPIGVPETTGGMHGEPMQRYDAQYPWLHGYWQEIPPYSGYAAFRPYNYKHVLSQAQAAGGWGMSPKMPYSQQYWHRYRDRAVVPMYSKRPANPAQESPRISGSSGYGPIISPAGLPGQR